MQMLVSKKFYQTKEFKLLNLKWRDLLEIAGFCDIEDHKENLRSYNDRTQAFKDRDQILSFYLAIEHYLTNASSIPSKHRELLELYMSNMKMTDISLKLDMSCRWCWKWIKHYKLLFLYKK